MKALTEIFSNRELATLIWGIVFLGAILVKQRTRNSFGIAVKTFFKKRIIGVILSALIYTSCLIWILSIYGLWDHSFIKDSIFWFGGTAVITLFSLIDIQNEREFVQNFLFDYLKLTIILEFILNIKSFSFFAEVIILPILVLVYMSKIFADGKPEYRSAFKLLEWVISIVGLIILTISIREIILNHDQHITISTLKSFLLPIYLSLSFIPFAYLIALYMSYGTLFSAYKVFLHKKSDRSFAKRRSILVCGFSITRIKEMNIKASQLYKNIPRKKIKSIISLDNK